MPTSAMPSGADARVVCGARFTTFASALAFATLVAIAGPVATSATTIVTPTIGGTPWTPDEIARLDGDLDSSLAGEASLHGAHVGVLAVDTATGTVLYDRRSDEAFQPASTLKLVVGSAALDLLGPEFAWTTKAYAAPQGGGTLDLVVGGDPFFSFADVRSLVAAVRASRVASIPDVVVRIPLDEMPHPAGWTFDDFAQNYAPAISAATLEENVVHVRVRPGDAARGPAMLDVAPDPPLVAADPSACSPLGTFLVDAATTSSPGSETTVDADASGDGCRRIIGSLATNAPPVALDVAVPDPASYLVRATVAALRAGGVAVGGNGRVDVTGPLRTIGRTQVESLVWQHAGSPLRDVMPRFWIPSDNFVGEELLMALSRSDERSRVASLDAERDWLRSIGVDPATTTLADGSGLSQYDRITPRDLVTILQHDWNGPNRQIVLDALPVGGVRGTIEGISGTPAAGRVFAKTGSMMHVRGLAGYLASQHHGAVTFAFEVDDWLGTYAALAAVRAAVLSRIVDDRGERAP